MNLKHVLAGSATGLLALACFAGGAMAQTEPLEARVGTSSSIQNPSIRFIEARELSFREAISRNNAPVGTIFNDSNATTNSARGYADSLQSMGVGQNSEVATVLCAIEALEVSSRQETLDDVYFHLSKVYGLLYGNSDMGSENILTATTTTYDSDRAAMYQSMHAAMETTNCVQDTVNAAIDEAEQTRLAIVWESRQASE